MESRDHLEDAVRDLIGFFDSGVGGLSVLHTARTLLPGESFLYYGDNGNAPYGPRPLSEIRALAEQGIDRLMARDIKALVIACNTATSAYADILRAKTSLPVIGMEPAIKPAQLSRTGGYVLALATRATLSLPKFQRLMSKYGECVLPVVGEGFVELVERDRMDSDEALDTVQRVLAPYAGMPVDSVVLGCTHYPFLLHAIRRTFPDCAIYDGRMGTVLQLKRMLEARGLLSAEAHGSIQLETSGGPDILPLMRRLMDYLEDNDL